MTTTGEQWKQIEADYYMQVVNRPHGVFVFTALAPETTSERGSRDGRSQ